MGVAFRGSQPLSAGAVPMVRSTTLAVRCGSSARNTPATLEVILSNLAATIAGSPERATILKFQFLLLEPRRITRAISRAR